MVEVLRKKSRSQQKKERQTEILYAAIEVIAEKGFEKTRISDIADRAGVAYGLIYHYYGAKEKILMAIFENLWNRFERRIERIIRTQRPAVDRLAMISDYMLDTYIARPDIMRLLVQEVVRAHNIVNLPEMDIVRRIIGKIELTVQMGIDAGELSEDADARLLSFAFFGSVEMVLTALITGLYRPDGEPDYRNLKKVKKSMRDFIFSGSFGLRPV